MDVMTEHKVVPKLRFGEFEDDWNLSTLNDLTKLVTKGTTPKLFTYEGVHFVKIEALDGIHIRKEKCLYIDEKTHYSSLKRSILKVDDILFAIAGATIGKLGIVSNEILPANTNQALAIIRLENTNSLNYILQILQSTVMKKYIYKNISVGAQPNLSLKQINDFSFFIPSLPEQQKIASFLSAVDEKLQQLTKKKELLEEYKKGVMQKIFSQELRFKDEFGNNYPDWEEKRIEDLFIVTRGTVLAIPKISPHKNDECPYPVYSSQTKNNGIAGYYKDYLFEDAITWTTDGAQAGEVNLRKGKFYCTNVCGVLKSDEGYANLCIAEKLNRVSRRYVSYVGNPKLMNNVMAKIKISIPTSLDEQQKIANFLSSLDSKIKLVITQIENTKSFKKGLQQQMFV